MNWKVKADAELFSKLYEGIHYAYDGRINEVRNKKRGFFVAVKNGVSGSWKLSQYGGLTLSNNADVYVSLGENVPAKVQLLDGDVWDGGWISSTFSDVTNQP